jgi:hypothetical protein
VSARLDARAPFGDGLATRVGLLQTESSPERDDTVFERIHMRKFIVMAVLGYLWKKYAEKHSGLDAETRSPPRSS